MSSICTKSLLSTEIIWEMGVIWPVIVAIAVICRPVYWPTKQITHPIALLAGL